MENLKNGLRCCVVLALLGVIVLASCTMGNNEADARQITPEENVPFSFGTLDREEFDRLVQVFLDFYECPYSNIRDSAERVASLLCYIGTFNNTVVFRYRDTGGFMMTLRVLIGGVKFTNSHSCLPIFVWTDERVFPLRGVPAPPGSEMFIPNAYDKGFLTREDLQYIADVWHSLSFFERTRISEPL